MPYEMRSEMLRLSRADQHARSDLPPVACETYIPSLGKVMDAKDRACLIDASLDMLLTSGRCASQFEKEMAHRLGVRCAKLVVSAKTLTLVVPA